jgi:hypothetical protein
MGLVRRCIALGVAAALITGCSDRGAVGGVFNNEPDYQRAMREHEASWRREIGDTVARPKLAALMRGAGGQCYPDDGLIICIVNVEARWPRIFVTRHMWRVEFKSTDEGKLKRQRSYVDILGWDL